MFLDRIKIIVVLSFTLFFVTQCIDPPEEFVLPNWDVTVNVPLAADTVFMHELLDPADEENIKIVDHPEWGDSIYLIVVEDIETVSRINDKLQIPVPLVPGSLNLSGFTGGYEIKAATIYNPDPEYHIDTAEFISGELRFLMTNSSNFDAEYEIVLPGFKNKSSNEMVVLSGTAVANSSNIISFSLADVVYTELPVTGVNDLTNYSTQAEVGFMVVGIARTQNELELNLQSRIDNSEITLSRLVGQLKKTKIDYFESSYLTDLGKNLEDFRDKIDFGDIRMYVDAELFGQLRNVKIVLDSMTVQGVERGSDMQSFMQFNGTSYFKDSLIAGVSFNRVFDKSNSSLNEFLSRLPDEVVIGTKLYIEKNPDAEDDTQVISNEDSIKFNATIKAPLNLAIREVSYDDTTNVDLTQDDIDAIDNATSASLTVDIESYIALGASLRIIIMDSYYNELFVLTDDNGNDLFTLTPAQVDNNGIPASASVDRLTMTLNSNEIQLLTAAKFISFEAAINSQGSTSTEFGPYVRIRAKDFFTYKIYGTVDYHLDLEELKED